MRSRVHAGSTQNTRDLLLNLAPQVSKNSKGYHQGVSNISVWLNEMKRNNTQIPLQRTYFWNTFAFFLVYQSISHVSFYLFDCFCYQKEPRINEILTRRRETASMMLHVYNITELKEGSKRRNKDK